MTENCLDIGTIQAFLDGELAHAQTARVSGHIAKCDNCAVMLAEADDESAAVFSVLSREMDTLVPTQRLWNRINDSIETQNNSRPTWQKAYAFISVAFLNPSITAAAGMLIVAGMVGIIWMKSDAPTTPFSNPNVARVQPQAAAPAVETTSAPSSVTTAPLERADRVTTTSGYRVERASYQPETRRATATAAAPAGASYNNAGYLPGEESYVRTISVLSKTADEQVNTGIMRASERIAYERDMAVVEDAIKKMKREIRRNPKNDAAKQVLYASYQNKIELLNSVSQKEELLVSLR